MNQPALPEYLRNRQGPKLSDRALDGLGISQPPHISFRGNRFTLIDQAGNEQQVQTVFLDVCIVDLSGLCKKYFANEWEPGSTDPPACFSTDGIVPSVNALNQQARTCAECQWNKIGSAVSKLSGVGIKACRDEKWLAVMQPGQNMLFQLVLTPGSFKNWTAYVERFRGQEFDLQDVVTRLNFEAGKNGVLTFDPAAFIDQVTAELRNKAKGSKATDIYVGRSEAPRQITAPQPAVAGGLAIPAATGPFAVSGSQPGFALPATNIPSGGVPSTPATPAVQPASPPPQSSERRRRRTKAEMEAARAGQPAVQETAPQPAPAPQQGFTPAPFRPAAGAEGAITGGPNGPAPQFGMSPGVAPNPELAATLKGLMGG